jgi:transposase
LAFVKKGVMVNQAATKRNKENRDNSPSKSDPKDALVMADVVSRGYYYEYSRQATVFQKLRTIMSDREFLVTNSGKGRLVYEAVSFATAGIN